MEPTTQNNFVIHTGDALEVLKTLESESVNMCVTSPPYYGLRDYGVAGQVGLEETPEQYIEKLVNIFREVRRVMKDDGTLWVNIGDSYYTAGDCKLDNKQMKSGLVIPKRNNAIPNLKKKDLIGIPWMLAFALRNDGWFLRSEIIWHKPAVMPESVKDRPTKSHEYIFLLSKSEKYYYDADAISEPCQTSGKTRMGKSVERAEGSNRNDGGVIFIDGETRNRRSVWTIGPSNYKGAHFATFPPELPKICIQAGTSKHGCCPDCFAVFNVDGQTCKCKLDEKQAVPCQVLDPFSGTGTTGVVAISLNCAYHGIEINPEYVAMSQQRLSDHLAKPENFFSQASLDDLFEVA